MQTAPFSPSPPSAGMALFRRQGLVAATDAQLAEALGTTPEALAAQHPTRESLVLACLLDDLERQKRDHTGFYARFASPVERLYALISYTIQDLVAVDPRYLTDFAHYPAAWQALQDHLAAYSTPQLHQLLNDGIRQGLFRSDINIQLVTIIIVQQLNIALTPGIFPAGSFQPAEIFRSIFLYYIRGPMHRARCPPGRRALFPNVVFLAISPLKSPAPGSCSQGRGFVANSSPKVGE